jgi:hypothetical protein
MIHEPDILNYVRPGRASFLDVHRRCQELILDWLDKNGYTDVDGEKFTKTSIVNIDEVKSWATYMALRLIFEGLSNSTEDVFAAKAQRYLSMEAEARKRLILRLDEDGDGVADEPEKTVVGTIYLVRG